MSSPQAALAEAEAARPATMADREDWRALPLVTIDPPDAKDHDDAVHAAPDADPANPGGFILTVAIADVAYYVRAGSTLDREAEDARQFGLFPRPRRADAARAHLQRPVLAQGQRGSAGARGADDPRRRRPQAPPHVPSRDDALGGQALLRAGAGGDRRQARRDDRAAAQRPRSNRSTPPIAPSSSSAPSAIRSISTCPNASSSSIPRASSSACAGRSGWRRIS